ncbi:hypothetical protein [Immundisolibacter sp.]|uniref:hypothetical protein n=1 Tax=Immundisolibacter sp. TaxID=1934948 RepID=UPI003561BEC4
MLTAIGDLPADSPVDDPKKWYLTQQEHWMGWLSEYDGPGAYGRQTRVARDAKFAYNHTVEPKMLLYLAGAAGVERELIAAANRAFTQGRTLMQKAGAIRAIVPWETVAVAL